MWSLDILWIVIFIILIFSLFADVGKSSCSKGLSSLVGVLFLFAIILWIIEIGYGISILFNASKSDYSYRGSNCRDNQFGVDFTATSRKPTNIQLQSFPVDYNSSHICDKSCEQNCNYNKHTCDKSCGDNCERNNVNDCAQQVVKLTLNGTECKKGTEFSCEPAGFSEIVNIALPSKGDVNSINEPVELYTWTSDKGTVFTYKYIIAHGTSFVTIVPQSGMVAIGKLSVEALRNVSIKSLDVVAYVTNSC